MKNFRKVLALILVVATLFSFTAMASAKTTADYKDGDSVSYKEAVDVLSAIGVLNGYEDDTFKPTDNIGRDEMAKMIAVLANAGDDVSELYASALPFTDCGDGDVKWAASYIAYCAQTGIVAGRSATTFDPRANVTGLETAKMLLCVLGFDAAEQGYVGANWKINVLRDAKNVGLLDGFAADYDVSKAITREEAANMFLNALVSPIVVGTLSNNVVKISNALYYDSMTDITLIDAEKYGWVVLYGNVVVSDVQLYTIFAGLSLDTATRDCYGRPGHTWTYRNAKGTVLDSVFYVDTADLVYTKAATLASDLKEELDSGYKFVWFNDGLAHPKNGPAVYTADDLKYIADEFTGNGVRTEVYVNDHDKTVDIIIISTFIDKVDYVTLKANTFTLAGSDETYDNKDYGFSAGDIVLYWLCSGDGSLHFAKVAEPVTAKVTRVTASGTITADGKTYEYAENFDTTMNSQAATMDVPNVGKTYDLYLDEYGYVMWYEEHVDSVDVYYAYAVEGTGLSVWTGKTGTGEWTWDNTKDLVDFDAKYTKDAKVDKDTFELALGRYDYGKYEGTGMLFAYTLDNGVANILTDEDGDIVKGLSFANTARAHSIVTAAGDITRHGEVVKYGTDETKYLVRTVDYTTGEYVYTAFTGKLDKDYVGYVYEDTETGDKLATIQYFLDGKGFLEYVFVDAIYTTTSAKAFVLGYSDSVSDITFVKQIGAYDEYDAIINGVRSKLLVTQDWTTKLENTLYQAKFECIGLTDQGLPVYHAVGALETTTQYKAYGYYEGRLYLVNPDGAITKAYRVAEDAIAVVAFNGGHDDLDAITLKGVDEVNNYLESAASIEGAGDEANFLPGNAWIVESDGVVSELYLVVSGD